MLIRIGCKFQSNTVCTTAIAVAVPSAVAAPSAVALTFVYLLVVNYRN